MSGTEIYPYHIFNKRKGIHVYNPKRPGFSVTEEGRYSFNPNPKPTVNAIPSAENARRTRIYRGGLLYNACFNKDSLTAINLIKEGWEKDNIDFNFRDEGITILMEACRKGLTDVVKMLLATGRVDVNYKNEYGFTALLQACVGKNEDTALVLLAQPKIRVEEDPDALAFAKKNKLTRVIERMETMLNSRTAGGKRTMSKTQRKRKSKCRLVVGKQETCCIKPRKGHWCWSKGIKRQISRKMKHTCCR
jgi:Ankyrin repeats (3 copies)